MGSWQSTLRFLGALVNFSLITFFKWALLLRKKKYTMEGEKEWGGGKRSNNVRNSNKKKSVNNIVGHPVFQLRRSISMDRQRYRTICGGHCTWKCVQIFLPRIKGAKCGKGTGLHCGGRGHHTYFVYEGNNWDWGYQLIGRVGSGSYTK